MKLIGKALVLGLAVAAASVSACSSQPNQSPSSGTGAAVPGDNSGTVGFNYTLPSGQIINQLNYTLTNGVNTYTGVINVSGATSLSFVIGGVASGSGYTLMLSGETTDNTTSCTGTSAPFAVADRSTTAVTVQLICTTSSDAGSIVVTPVVNDCPIWNTIVANPASPGLAVGSNTSLLTASATGPNNTQLVYTWSVLAGTGTLSNESANGTTNSTITFTCPATAESDTVQVVVSDQTGTTACTAPNTTASIKILCGNPPCYGVGTGTEANPNSAVGTCPTGQSNILKDTAGNFCCAPTPCLGIGTSTEANPDTALGTCPAGQANTLQDTSGNFCCATQVLSACTSATQTYCVTCAGNAHGGICTPTEAALVNHDIALGIAKAPVAPATTSTDPATGCYTCLQSAKSLDSTKVSGDECEDVGPGEITTGTAAQCEAVLSCILASGNGTTASSCAGNAVNNCYCGPEAPGSACASAGTAINGVCDQQIATGLNIAFGQDTAILEDLEDQTTATGVATSLFQAAIVSNCNACLE